MTDALYTLTADDWEAIAEDPSAVKALESGQVIYLPSFSFKTESPFSHEILSENLLRGNRKNLSFDQQRGRLGGFKPRKDQAQLQTELTTFMRAYALFARKLVDNLLPQYQSALIWGRTSYRPAEIKGRPTSKRKDDTRLHVDAFPATPVNGLRILRVFCNINPDGQARVWHLGEHFDKVVQRFAPELPKYRPQWAQLLKRLKLTKSLRTAYDHYQLCLHDRMKLNDEYQKTVQKEVIHFKAESTWVVFTDSVSHAALAGQFLLEQTFYLPATAMAEPERAPLHYWNNRAKREHREEVRTRGAITNRE